LETVVVEEGAGMGREGRNGEDGGAGGLLSKEAGANGEEVLRGGGGVEEESVDVDSPFSARLRANFAANSLIATAVPATPLFRHVLVHLSPPVGSLQQEGEA
jgi:hypothetical protein